MNSKISQLQVFPRSLKFQNRVRFVALIVIMVLLTIILSVKAGYANPLSSIEAEASAQACPAGMISYWKFEETGGSAFTDSVGSNHASCLSDNCPLSVPNGNVNRGLQFVVDETSVDEVDVPNHSSFNFSNTAGFTVEAWVQTTQACSSNKVFVGKHSGRAGWWLGCSTSNSLATFYIRDSNRIAHQVQTTVSLKDGNWHHVVGIRDGASNQSLVYVDGVLRASQSPTDNFTGHFTNTQPLGMGYHNRGRPAYHFNGILDEVAVYNRALTASEVLNNYNAGFAGQAYCDAATAPEILPLSDQSAVVNQLFTYDVDATGSPAPTFSLTTKPDGMTIDASTGIINWTPTTAGTFNVTVRATNSVGFNAKSFKITVTSTASAPVVTPIPNQNIIADTLYTYKVNATGSPSPTFSLTTKPDGMTIHPVTGVITWTPETAGTFNVTVRATNSAGSNQKSFTITVTEDYRMFLPIVMRK